MEETLKRVENIISNRKPVQHVCMNVAKLVLVQDNKQYIDIINSCGIINVDGAGIMCGAGYLGVKIPERVAGIDLMQRLVELSSRKGYRIYFL